MFFVNSREISIFWKNTGRHTNDHLFQYQVHGVECDETESRVGHPNESVSTRIPLNCSSSLVSPRIVLRQSSDSLEAPLELQVAMLFISHSTRDKAEALNLHALLLERGDDPKQLFLDSDEQSGIGAGEKWKQVLYGRLKECHLLIVLCSPNWKASQWCFAEFVYA